MIRKIILIFCLFLVVGCTNDINDLTLEEIIDTSIKEEANLHNTNYKGYRYYLPSEFTVKKNSDFNQELVSRNNIYYLNVDIVSYYYKKEDYVERDISDYKYYSFEEDDKTGYLRIRKNNDNFFVELCYNYAIIEVEVEESELRYAVSRGIIILKSIRYNDLVIEKYINDNDLKSSETIYKIPEPKEKDDSKNILQYIEESEKEE